MRASPVPPAARPDPDDRRQRYDHRGNLGDAKHQNDGGERAGPRHSCDEEGKADEDRLDERHPHDAQCDGANGRDGEPREARAALLPGDALEDGQATAGAAFSEGQEDAGEDEGAEKGEQAAADAGDEAERGAGKIADLRLHALHEGGQIIVRPAPQGVEFRRQ